MSELSPQHLEKVKRIKRAVKDLGLEDGVRFDYSGRGTFGRQCLAVILSNPRNFVDVSGVMGRTDSMGLENVLYWPFLEISEEKWNSIDVDDVESEGEDDVEESIKKAVDSLLGEDEMRVEDPSKSDAIKAMKAIEDMVGRKLEPIKRAFLTFQSEESNKYIYIVMHKAVDGSYHVDAAYSRIGYDPKTTNIVRGVDDKDEALKEFDSYVAKKLKKGYEIHTTTESLKRPENKLSEHDWSAKIEGFKDLLDSFSEPIETGKLNPSDIVDSLYDFLEASGVKEIVSWAKEHRKFFEGYFEGCDFDDIDSELLEPLYDYADAHNIWIG